MNLLTLCSAILLCAFIQQPAQLSALAATNAYVRRIDVDKTLIIKRHIHTYGHAAKPGADSLFWVFHTDFPHSSAVIYLSGSKIVKLVETARTDKYFTENSYYLQNSKLLFVRNRQVECPAPAQAVAWRSNTPPCTKATDCFFRGAYYFVQDSCVSKWERGRRNWRPDYDIPGGGGRSVTVPEIFPLQAARYVAIFGKVLAHKKQLPNLRP